jgi:hypothetical protein
VQFLKAASAIAAKFESLKQTFPAVVVMNNPKLEELKQLDSWIKASGRRPRYVLQVCNCIAQ